MTRTGGADADGSEDDLRTVQARWDDLGRDDPMWAVLTDRTRAGNRWDVDEFLSTGEVEIDGVFRDLARMGVEPRGRALDFGCGAGRLVHGLARHMDEVVGVDIAASMIRTAEEINRNGERCRFLLNTRADLSILDGQQFDLVYSCRVLQHMPPSLSRRYIGDLVRAVRPGSGVLVFQIPAAPSSSLIGRALRLLPAALVDRVRKMQMHGLAPTEVRRLIAEAGGDVVDVAADTSAGPHWESFRYTVRRSS